MIPKQIGIRSRQINPTTTIPSLSAQLEADQERLSKEADSLVRAYNIANEKANEELIRVDMEIRGYVNSIKAFMEKQYALQ